ncbi:MAG TPA: potassium-transporting ATPase subunit KdpA, partial [Candidatus Kryptobacter bacterium]|nr:potassium-transporting ATPase subunit KdpA [Candidatus Kryptobacter bacterium]
KNYLFAVLAFSVVGLVVLWLMMVLQAYLPWNPQHLPNVSWDLAFNTAVSFMTNTNWQSYAGETTLSYFVQMVGLTVHNFVSAAAGIAVVLALIRGISRKTTTGLGNFWADLVRTTLYILLPLSIILAFVLVGEGTVQTLKGYAQATTLEGQEQVIPVGPAASQIAIKQLGTNGGGFFNANSAHPFENPTPVTDFLEMLSILLIASALVYTYGKMVGSLKQAFVLWTVMLTLFMGMLALSLYSEYKFHPTYASAPSMEGKETRFGVTNSILWEVSTTVTSNGSVNSMHDSLTPLSGMVALVDMMYGEVVFGGVGAGLYGMLLFVLLTVFIAGLMVGRTPEYLGKKIEAYEVKMSVIGILAPSAAILVFAAIASVTKAGLAGLNNQGPHGLSEILYAFTSAGANNGSAFAGLTTNTLFYDVTQGIDMLIGRFVPIAAVLAVAGSLGKKKAVPPSAGTFPTDSTLFGFLLIGVIFIVVALTFFPVLALGPIVEHFLMLAGKTF